MGRCLSKPVKRLAFQKADEIAVDAEEAIFVKYSSKMKRKRIKCRLVKNKSDDLFLVKLRTDLLSQRGLSHSKCKEYWLLRGPRLFCVMNVAVFGNIGLSEILKDDPGKDRHYRIISGSLLIVLTFYMLYKRLSDAIISGMLRVGHDSYVKWKSNIRNRSTLICDEKVAICVR